MNGDHIMGLPSVVMNNHIKKTDDDENDNNDDDNDEDFEDVNRPLMIYGPQGLHEYLCTFMRLTDTNLTQEIIVHEMIISEDDVKRTFHNKPIPWYKPLNKFQHSPLDHRKHTPLIRRVEIKSDSEGLWPLVDDPRIKVNAGLISHRTPSFGFVIKETDQVGSLDSNKCKHLGMKNDSSHGLLFKDLKSGKDIKLENNTIIRAKDVLGPSILGRKIVILGDTSDASVLSSAAKDCDILVHEATYSNEYEQISKLKGHSTPNMAALTALQFNAKRLILNHIGNIYLPHFIDSKNNEQVVLSKATDKMLYEEASKALNRSQHVIVSRDFTVAKIPVGGYKIDNDEFYYINTAVAVPYNNASKSHLDYFVSPSMKPILKPTYNKYKMRNNSYQNNSYQNSNNKSKNINNSIQK
jgi:ribonuclease Z